MEDWFAEGRLTQEEFDQLVRLTARYVYWDVDQFDAWELPTPGGSMYVDFNQSGPTPYGDEMYRVLWPSLPPGQPGWTVCIEDAAGTRPVATFADEGPAQRAATRLTRPGARYVVQPPPPNRAG